MTHPNSPVILIFCADLFFSMRIESVVQQGGFTPRVIETAEQIAPGASNVSLSTAPGEHLTGQGGALIDTVSRMQPTLMIFDMNNENLPWVDWIALLRSVPATRRIPVLAFGSHKNVEDMTRAKDAGASAVLARSRFVSEMAHLIEKYAVIPNLAGIQEACGDPLSALAAEGIRLFNAHEYFESHELLEDAWNEDTSEAKELYRAILQVAVAYLQVERGNLRGALKMFLRARQWFARLPAVCRGVNVEALIADAAQVETALREDGLDAVDVTTFPPVKFV